MASATKVRASVTMPHKSIGLGGAFASKMRVAFGACFA
jgi:hypothetical protein